MAAIPTLPNSGIILTERLQLQPANVEYVEDVFHMSRDPEISRFLAWDPPQHRDETDAMLWSLEAAMKREESYHWIACANDQAVGIVSLIDVKRQHRCWKIDRAELAYWIGKKHQGRGYATEAARAVMQYAFRNLGFHKLRVYHADGNDASANTINKLGYRLVGIEKEAFYKNDEWHDLVHYEMIGDQITLIDAKIIR